MALKSAALKLIRNNKADFEDQAKIFANPNSAKADVIKAGERALVCLYKGKSDDNLDSLHLQRYQQKISRRTTFVKPEVLPPTSGAVIYHSSGVARAFPGGRLAHPEGQNEEEISESLRKNKKT